MPLDPHVKRFLSMMAAAGGGCGIAPDADAGAVRTAQLRLAEALSARDEPIGRIENLSLPGPAGALPIRVYTPVDAAQSTLPGLIYFHGGAWVFCNLDTHDGLCRMLANASGCRVVAVAYRQAPEHRFPAAVEDSYAAAQWIAAAAGELGIDRHRLAVGGDSAGATLATVACQLANRDKRPGFALQLLLCPKTDVARQSRSRQAFAAGYFLDRSTTDWALQQYCPPGSDLTDPRLSPLYATDLSGLPPAEIHTAEFDPFVDEGKAYADKLKDSGVAVRYTCHPGMIHHFYGMPAAIPYARPALRAIGSAMKQALAQSSSASD
jgi:acetyl esterase/lipase